jgi:hypothetical protein
LKASNFKQIHNNIKIGYVYAARFFIFTPMMVLFIHLPAGIFRCIVYAIIVTLLIACNNSSTIKQKTPLEIQMEKNIINNSLLQDAKNIIQEGDLVLRGGKDFSSRFVKDINKKDHTYSHAGIAVRKNGELYIYHIIPDHSRTNDRVRFDKIDSFLVAYDNNDFGVARFKMSNEETTVFLTYLQQQYEKKIPFDMDFRLETDNEMYCSEMISKGLKLATNQRIQIKTDLLDDKSKYKLIRMYYKMPEKEFANREIIPIDHLFIDSNCTVIKRYHYEQ